MEDETQKQQFEKELNNAVFNDLGTFGDIAELARQQILHGYEKKVQVLPPELPKIPVLDPL